MFKEKKNILLATLSYLSSVAVLLSFLYWFLKNEGFTESNFLIAGLMVLFLATGWGYIISTHLLAPKADLDANLSIIVSEILHELNIPLSTIKGNTSLLKKRIKDEKSLQRIGRIEASSLRLDRLYKELVYSIKKEIHPIEKERLLLAPLLRERIETLEAFGRNKFILEIEEFTIQIDRIGFEKMVDNLLMNAMKYSSKESLIKVQLKKSRLVITDEGIGMDETQLLRVYERYYQGDKQKEGQGIGLALVKSYCDDEGITIQIQSEKSIGTIIYLNLEKVKV
ncbi:MAG: HAMP domain-containing sensor histidine kinase [Campylobacterota bacterium]|nr:HAMP domain-containing sensor histidine kinase [Campylobacterota bacterium]